MTHFSTCVEAKDPARHIVIRVTTPYLVTDVRWTGVSPASRNRGMDDHARPGGDHRIASGSFSRFSRTARADRPGRDPTPQVLRETERTKEMHRAVASSSGSPADLRLRDCHSGSHQPQKLRSRCSRDTTRYRSHATRTAEPARPTSRGERGRKDVGVPAGPGRGLPSSLGVGSLFVVRLKGRGALLCD
jgi:hypothetical protein